MILPMDILMPIQLQYQKKNKCNYSLYKSTKSFCRVKYYKIGFVLNSPLHAQYIFVDMLTNNLTLQILTI